VSELDQKQFEMLQSAVQQVVDEGRLEEQGIKQPIVHRQRHWGFGMINKLAARIPFEVPIVTSMRNTHNYQWQPICTTACCLAGTAVIMNGDTMVVAVNNNVDNSQLNDNYTADFCMDAQLQVHAIGERAQELMGLSEPEATYIFDACRSRERIVEYATQVAAKHGYTLEVV